MSSNPDLFFVKGDALPEEITVAAHEGCDESQSPDRDLEDGDQKAEEEEEEHCKDDGGRCNCRIEEVREKDLSEDVCCRTRLLGGNVRCLDGDDDGFRTPVSADRRIVSAAECPPAPKKPKPVPWRKRRLPPSDEKDDNGVGLIIHLSDEEVEAMFPSIVPPEVHKKIKRARTDGSHD